MLSRAIPLIAVLLTVAALPSGVVAQDAVPGVSLQIIPKIGAFLAGGDIGSFGVIENPTRTRLSNGLGAGVAVELALPLSPFNYRIAVDMTRGAQVRRDRALTGGSADVLNVAAGAVMRSFIRTPRSLQSYVLAGLGLKRYSFTPGSANVPQITDDHLDWTANVGAGFNIIAGPVWLVFEGTDYVSWFNPENSDISTAGKLQNDLFIQLGVRFLVF